MLMPTAIPPPLSCDTFVYVQAPSSLGVGTLFGKNSDRPSEEHHEVIRISRSVHNEDEVVQCTHISVPQATKTLECVLSRPCWLWGCEMGANECGVVGGNEAVHTVLSNDLLSSDGKPTKSLLGMDILRLALERGTTAKQAVDVCIHFLETYGQGGPCCEDDSDSTYENSFLFSDSNEAYVLETAGTKHWAWERISAGECRNISNGISIRSTWDALSKDIQYICKENGWWDGKSKFDWKRAVETGGSVQGLECKGGREASGEAHLKKIKAESGEMQPPRWYVEKMASILRDEHSGICFRDLHGFCSTGSQISWLSANDGVNSHFFSGASDPLCGTPYKLFLFSDTKPNNNEEQTDHDTKALWDIWRKRALSRARLSSSQSDALSKMEEEAFLFLDEKGKPKRAAFADTVQREIELLKNDC